MQMSLQRNAFSAQLDVCFAHAVRDFTNNACTPSVRNSCGSCQQHVAKLRVRESDHILLNDVTGKRPYELVGVALDGFLASVKSERVVSELMWVLSQDITRALFETPDMYSVELVQASTQPLVRTGKVLTGRRGRFRGKGASEKIEIRPSSMGRSGVAWSFILCFKMP